MDIKRIIREEVNDFEWISDIDARYVTIDNAHEGMKVQITDDSAFYKQGITHHPRLKEAYRKMVGKITNVYERNEDDPNNLVDVEWENGKVFYYRIGPNIYDLEVYGYNQLGIHNLKEENDFEWIGEIEPKSNNPQPDTAWVILNIPRTIEDTIKVQEYLFGLGFTWPGGQLDVMKDDTITSIGSVWKDNIYEGSVTYIGGDEPDWDEDRWLNTAKKFSRKDVMNIFRWTGKDTFHTHQVKIK